MHLTHQTISKKADNKGRVLLGTDFANANVLIKKRKSGELVISKAKIVPKHEAWLHENKSAYRAVQIGLKHARQGKFSTDPIHQNEDYSWIDELDD